MPRIAAALAVFLTAVTCIGFNTARYPVVWEMVASSEGLPKAQESELPAAVPQSIAASQSAALPQSAPARESQVRAKPAGEARGEGRGVRGEESSPVWTEGGPIMAPDCEPALPSAGHSHVPPNGQVEAAASAKYASLPLESTASPVEHAEDEPGREAEADTGGSDQLDPQTALVPVEPADSKRDALATRRTEPWEDLAPVALAGDSGGVAKVRRLPSVDQVSVKKTSPGPTPRPPRPGDPIPIYPTTGIQ